MVLWNEWHELAVYSSSQEFVDQVAASEAQMCAAREELGSASLDVLQL